MGIVESGTQRTYVSIGGLISGISDTIDRIPVMEIAVLACGGVLDSQPQPWNVTTVAVHT
jgi:hypothetical protein